MSSLTKYYDESMADTDRTPAQPRYLAIADDLRIQIATGELLPGDELPTLGDLSERYGVSDGIARQALQLLRQQALITRGRGRRSVVREHRVGVAATNRRALADKKRVREPEDVRRASGPSEDMTGHPVKDTDFEPAFEEIVASDETPGFESGTRVLHRVYETSHKETGYLLLSSESWLPLDLVETNPALLDSDEEPWPGGTQHQLYT
ncbi:MAG: GntR family transcriptional regulator, partial [Pseudonocardiaceae bacterium]